MKNIVIIGGGVTGMTALHELQKKQPDWHMTLVEKEKQLGGKIRTVQEGPFTIETGADSIVARNAGVLPLVEELELQDKLVYNETGVSYVYRDGVLHKLPEESVFGIPTSIASLNESTLVSEEGKRAALADLTKVDLPFGPGDSVGAFLTYYFGEELVEKQIAPVLSGVYSGRLEDLTIQSTLPYLLEFKQTYGSVMKGFAANKETFLGEKARKKFISFQGGLAALFDRMAEKSAGARIITGTEAVRIESGYRVVLNNGETLPADDIVLAVPDQAARALLQDERLEPAFSAFRNSSLISVYLGYAISDSRLPADGTGFIVTKGADLWCDACTWTSRKWSHTSNGELLVRLFYKSSSPHYEKVQAGGVVEAARRDIEKSLGISDEPATVVVTPWHDLMPNYHLGHRDAVESLTDSLNRYYPGIHIAGCSYFGVGIGACIQNGKNVAAAVQGRIS